MARKRKRRRGISLGTIVMLALTLVVCGACLTLLPKLQGNTELHVDASAMLNNLTLNGSLPELSLSDIPITVTTAQPTTVTATATPQPTMQPEIQQMLSTASPAEQTVTLTFGGSIYVESAVRKAAYFSETDSYDFEDMLSLLTDEMQADLTVVPLNNLLSSSGKYTDLTAPDAALRMLTAAGVNTVPLGFSTAYDQGQAGLSATLEAIRAQGLTAVGAYASEAEANTPSLLTVGGLKISILHYVDALSSTGRKKLKNENAAYALKLAEAETIATDIAQARNAGAQIVVVSLAWGTSGKTAPTKDQTALAQAIADSGADMIVGTGTKAVQPVVWLTGKDADGASKQVLCAYNLGALLTESRKKTTSVGGMLLHVKLTYANNKLTFDETTYTPTYIWRYKQGSQYMYRVLPSDKAAPDAMSDDQRSVMQKALKVVQDALADSPVTQRTY